MYLVRNFVHTKREMKRFVWLRVSYSPMRWLHFFWVLQFLLTKVTISLTRPIFNI